MSLLGLFWDHTDLDISETWKYQSMIYSLNFEKMPSDSSLKPQMKLMCVNNINSDSGCVSGLLLKVLTTSTKNFCRPKFKVLKLTSGHNFSGIFATILGTLRLNNCFIGQKCFKIWVKMSKLHETRLISSIFGFCPYL